MKLLFLDIDGVLNRYYTKTRTCTGCVDVEDDKIKLVQELIQNTGAKIILSSTWSEGFQDIEQKNIHTKAAKDLYYLISKFKEFGLEIFDYVIQVPDKHRGTNIRTWIENHTYHNIESILIIDDNSSWQPYGYFALKVSSWDGLNQKQIIKGTKILNTYSFPNFQKKLMEKEKISNR